MTKKFMKNLGLVFGLCKLRVKYVIPVLVIVAVLVLRGVMTKKGGEAEFFRVRTSFDKWVKEPHIDNIYFRNLRSALKKHPEMVPSYQNSMLQHLMASGETKFSRSMIEKKLTDLENAVCYFDRFARNSMLISLGRYKEALESTLQLKDDLRLDRAFWEKANGQYGSTLFAFNMLRIAQLYQKMGLVSEEFGAWKEFKRAVGMEPVQSDDVGDVLQPEALGRIKDHFREQNLTLGEYIASRERAI